MPAVTFSCPACGKVLKSAQPLPAGKKIKCPTCDAVFPMPDRDDEELASGVSTRPRPPAAVAPDREDDDEKPRRKAGRIAVEDEDDEDRPRRKKKASARRRSGGGLGLVLGAVAVVLLLFLVGGGVGAYFIWFSGVNRGSGNEDPLAFVPPQAEVLQGADFSALLNDQVFGSQVEKTLREQAKSGDFFEACKKETGLEFKELFAQALICTDLATFNEGGLNGGMPGAGKAAGGMAGPGVPMPPRGGVPPRPRGMTLILRPSRPFDQKKMSRSFKDPVRKTAHGKTYYDVNDGDLRTVFMPSDRTLILSNFSAGDLDPLFASDGTTPSVSADAVALTRGVDKSTIYVVIPFEGQVRAKLDDAVRQGKVGKGGPTQPLMEQVAKGKGVAFWGKLDGQQVKLGLNVLYADAAGATATVQAADTAWGAQKMALAVGAGILKIQMPKIGQLLTELADSVRFTTDGTTARVTAALGRTTLADAIAEGQNLQQGGGPFGGFNPGPGVGLPGGVPRPGGKK